MSVRPFPRLLQRAGLRLHASLPRSLRLITVVAGLTVPASAPAQETVIFRESFDTVAAPSLPREWRTTRNRSAGADDFQVAAGTAHSLPNAAVQMNATVAQELWTPSIPLSGSSQLALSFALRRSSTHAAAVVVELSTGGDSEFRVQIGDSVRPTGFIGYEVVQRAILLPTPPPEQVRIRWRIIPALTGSSGTLRIDDVTLTAAVARDLSLISLAVFPAIPAESTTVSVHLTALNTGTEPAGNAGVILHCDRDGDARADPDEAVAALPLPDPIGPGDTVTVAVGMQVPAAGALLLLGEIQFPLDQVSENNRRQLSVRVAPAWNRLVINEIQYSPAGDEPEWVEVFNPRGTDLAIEGWRLDDRRGEPVPPGLFPGCSIRAGEMLVLTGDSLACAAAHPRAAEKIRSVSSFPVLNNTGDHLYLRDPTGAIVDSLVYQPSWGGKSGGISMERMDWSAPSQDPANWGSCSGRAGSTPGETNSIAIRDTDLAVAAVMVDESASDPASCVLVRLRNAGRKPVSTFSAGVWFADPLSRVPVDSAILDRWSGELLPGDSIVVRLPCERPLRGILLATAVCRTAGDRRQANDTLSAEVRFTFQSGTLVINEIMAAPVAAGAEYVEIFNPGPADVDLRQWTLSQGSTTREEAYRLASETAMLSGGGFYVLANDSSLFRCHTVPQDVANSNVRILGTSSLGLNNSGDRVVLRDPSGRVVDSVEYRSNWHRPEIVDPGGRSLERIHPLLPSADRQSWSTSVDWTGGTPGRPNSIVVTPANPAGSLSCSPSPFSPDGDGRDDFTLIRYENPCGRGSMSVRIFDLRGRLVRWLAVGEPSAARGAIAWDGKDEDRRSVRIGIYVVLAETEDSGGAVWRAKAVVVVAGRL